MKIYYHLNEIPFTEKGIVTIGTFDGLHIGHRRIIDQLCLDSKEIGAESFVITFSNHPFEVLHPDKVPDKIASLDFKIDFFRKKEINHLILIKFTPEFAGIGHGDFFYHLSKSISVMKMVLGDGFRFGKENLGDLDFLESQVDGEEFSLEIIPRVSLNSQSISSSEIRRQIKKGEIELASQYLGRDYFIEGTAIRGEQIGRNIGFPTINITHPLQVMPKNGVYKTKVEINEQIYPAMTFVGVKSLGQTRNPVIETHIFNFDREVYEQEIRIHFVKRIRDEMKFASLDELKQQLERDKLLAR